MGVRNKNDGKTRALCLPNRPILVSVVNSGNGVLKSYVNYRAWRDSKRPILVSVVNSRNGMLKSYVNYRACRDPMLPFLDSVARSGQTRGLSPGKEATFAPKVSCFTVPFFARSHRLRAPAPYMSESSIVLTDSGGPGSEANAHCKTRHFRHRGRLFPERDADLGPKSGIWPESGRKKSPHPTVFPEEEPAPGRN